MIFPHHPKNKFPHPLFLKIKFTGKYYLSSVLFRSVGKEKFIFLPLTLCYYPSPPFSWHLITAYLRLLESGTIWKGHWGVLLTPLYSQNQKLNINKVNYNVGLQILFKAFKAENVNDQIMLISCLTCLPNIKRTDFGLLDCYF